jgi:monoamine oxidase
MPALSRRQLLAASAATVAAGPAPVRAAQAPSEVDIAIIGAGAAGIAAARRLATTRARFVVLEASGRVGGRCFTDTETFGMPYDRGAHWIHQADLNPVTPLAVKSGFDIYPAPPGQRVRIGRRYAREGEMEDYLTALVRGNRAIIEAGRGRTDPPAAQTLPRDLGDWQRTVEFMLGPFASGKDLADVSAADFARSTERDSDTFCRQGLGALMARLGEGLPIQLSNPASRIDWGGRGIEVDTAQGHLYARAAIVTVSTGVLASDKLKFVPELSKRQLDAIERLKPGSYDHIALELPGNPLGLERDEMAFEKSDSGRTAAILANVSGSPLCMVIVAGKFGRDLSAMGDRAMISFALDWLTGLYGPEVKRAVKRTHATQWNNDPWTLGAFSAAAPGGQLARATLTEPQRDRIFFAGEATHETLWGTVGGAWASGERAADLALKRLGFVVELQEPKRPPPAATTPQRRRLGPG